MIRLTCTSCNAVLTIDDAFAGGVCRCIHCGTIQTVPASLKGSSGAPHVAAKTLYQTKARAGAVAKEGSGESAAGSAGLDELAEVVTSSGLRSNRLRDSDGSSVEAPMQKPESGLGNNAIILMAGGGGVILALLIVVVYLLMKGPSGGDSNRVSPVNNGSDNGTVQQPVARVPAGPNFCGVKLSESSVIYLLDRGDSSRSSLPAMKQACMASLQSLGSSRSFQVAFWYNGSEFAFPNSMKSATSENIQLCRQAIDEIYAVGASEVQRPLKTALAASPAVIVIVTGKGWSLDDKFASDVLKLRGKSNVKIHAISIGSGESPPLKKIAKATGGEYRELSESELSAFSPSSQ